MHQATISGVRDRRERDGAATQRTSELQQKKRCNVRYVDIEGRIDELQGRIARGEPIFREGERFSPGYGTYQVGTLADELACDVLNNDGRENQAVAVLDEQGGDDGSE